MRQHLTAARLFLGLAAAPAQTTTFTNQGQLLVSGSPHTGSAEFQFTVWDAASGGTQLAATTPAITAGNVSGVISSASLPASPDFSGTVRAAAFTGNGANRTALNASQLTSGNSAPARRFVTYGGNSIYGVLSVSTLGIGNLATFGNASTIVSTLTTSGTWSTLAFEPTSDRDAKENFATVDPLEVLEKVASLPLARWNCKAAPGLGHIAPVAQDFHAAFGLNGSDDKHIATVGADGVALAAIRG